MIISLRLSAAVVLLATGSALLLPLPALAYSCMAEFSQAQNLVDKAQALVAPGTDSRVLAMIAEARGIAEAGMISHKEASEGHTGEVGKYMHSDAVRKGKWAQDLAKEAIFLINGEIL
jgi:hypothetical protein